jgi:hypothetical protein
MEARIVQVFVLVLCPALLGATFQTEQKNFVVNAPTPEIATKVGRAAEHFRKQLAVEWLGHELPRWANPCPIRVKVGQIGAGGQTTFSFFPNGKGSAEVCNWDMQIQGSLERILDSVLPHEVSHTIFACHFRRPLPRWADEGGATLAEHDSEKRQQVLRLKQVIGTRRRIALKNLFNIKEYPPDMQDVLTLYAEGYSVAELLVQEGGRARYLKFLADAHREGWEKAVHTNYGYRSVDDLEKRWHNWVMAGSPETELPQGQQLADSAKSRPVAAKQEPIVRGQSPSADPFLDEPSLNEPGLNQPVVKEPALKEMRRARLESVKVRVPPEERTLPTATATDKPAQALPGKNRLQGEVAQNRSSTRPRQATEWSEFPPDPRPSPLVLRGRR